MLSLCNQMLLLVKDDALAPPSNKEWGSIICISRKRLITSYFTLLCWPLNAKIVSYGPADGNPVKYSFLCYVCTVVISCHLHAGLSFTPAQWSNSSSAQFTFTTSFQRTTVAFPSPFHLQHVMLRGWFPFISRKITLFPSLPHASISISWELLLWNLLTQVITNTETAKNLIRFLYFIIICATLISFWFDIFLYPSNEFNYPALIKVWVDCFMSVKASGNKDLVFRIEKSDKRGTRWHLGHIVFSDKQRTGISQKIHLQFADFLNFFFSRRHSEKHSLVSLSLCLQMTTGRILHSDRDLKLNQTETLNAFFFFFLLSQPEGLKQETAGVF